MRHSAALTALSIFALAACGQFGAPAPPGETKSGELDPRVVQARGTLAESEQATIAIFESASPSVVLVISGAPSQGGFQSV
ncbi:MAG: hypothetical protein AB7G05_13865, partial [Hyphomonadaceae bacterium]